MVNQAGTAQKHKDISCEDGEDDSGPFKERWLKRNGSMGSWCGGWCSYIWISVNFSF